LQVQVALSAAGSLSMTSMCREAAGSSYIELPKGHKNDELRTGSHTITKKELLLDDMLSLVQNLGLGAN
jgi:hypothetical protein